ncbi:class I SAM-dependent methyltransferase [Actinomycetospora sp. NBRC 106375]|uniref:class I SAM-dependent methyltransferase n=1 Tax=Actinomycetospora sp. NBRC 106375 TaxID=3032207 RepID=UPI002552CD7C|nr:class I SAM-dependent methyltransferase [Actinomycetospora sp. NBRC 106375]
MGSLPDFDSAYQGEPLAEGVADVPWNIGEPQPAIAALVEAGWVRSPVLDAGCGIGATVLDLAARGYEVVGLDAASAAVDQARAAIRDRGLSAEVEVADISDFTGYDGRFATVVDSTLFHSMPVNRRAGYLAAIARASQPGAVLHVLVFDVTAPFPDDVRPNAVSAEELREAVAPFWTVDMIRPSAIHAYTPPEWGPDLPLDGDGRRMLPAHLLTAHLPS